LGIRVAVLATTSRLDSVASALRRPGRLDMEIEVILSFLWPVLGMRILRIRIRIFLGLLDLDPLVRQIRIRLRILPFLINALSGLK
jgi:SpoVK/Ycf46/Vps4 family AAA+-type ATPase